MKKEEEKVRGGRGEAKAVSERLAWVTGNLMVSFLEVGTWRGVCCFGEESLVLS